MADPTSTPAAEIKWEWPIDRAVVLRELEKQATKSGKRALDKSMFSRDQFGEPSRKRSALDRHVLVPSYCAWYHMDVVHDIERRACPDFFNGVHAGRTPKIYRDCRDFMVNHYRRNPRKYLSLDACLEMMTGDIQGIRQVWEFLNEWGLINHLADLDTLPSFSVVSNRRALRELGESGGDDDDDDNVDSKRGRGDVIHTSGFGRGSDVVTPQRHFSSARSGFFPGGSSWTTSETLDLINAINSHGDDWNKIAASVGGGKRSREECVAHFLSLPVEGGAKHAATKNEEEEHAGSKMTTATAAPLSQKGEHHASLNNPLSDSSNPLLAQVSFLASLVPPHIAAAAAQGAVQALLEEDAFSREQLFTAVTDFGEQKGGSGGNGAEQAAAAQASCEGETARGVGIDTKVDTDAFYRTACALASAAAGGSGLSILGVKSAAAAALGSAAIKSRVLVQKEEELLEDLAGQVVAHQLKKLDMRMKYCEALEGVREREYSILEKSWQQLHADRVAVNEANREVQKHREALKGYIKSAVAARDACLLATVKAERSVEEFIHRAEVEKRNACEEAVRKALAERGDNPLGGGATRAVVEAPPGEVIKN